MGQYMSQGKQKYYSVVWKERVKCSKRIHATRADEPLSVSETLQQGLLRKQALTLLRILEESSGKCIKKLHATYVLGPNNSGMLPWLVGCDELEFAHTHLPQVEGSNIEKAQRMFNHRVSNTALHITAYSSLEAHGRNLPSDPFGSIEDRRHKHQGSYLTLQSESMAVKSTSAMPCLVSRDPHNSKRSNHPAIIPYCSQYQIQQAAKPTWDGKRKLATRQPPSIHPSATALLPNRSRTRAEVLRAEAATERGRNRCRGPEQSTRVTVKRSCNVGVMMKPIVASMYKFPDHVAGGPDKVQMSQPQEQLVSGRLQGEDSQSMGDYTRSKSSCKGLRQLSSMLKTKLHFYFSLHRPWHNSIRPSYMQKPIECKSRKAALHRHNLSRPAQGLKSQVRPQVSHTLSRLSSQLAAKHAATHASLKPAVEEKKTGNGYRLGPEYEQEYEYDSDIAPVFRVRVSPLKRSLNRVAETNSCFENNSQVLEEVYSTGTGNLPAHPRSHGFDS